MGTPNPSSVRENPFLASAVDKTARRFVIPAPAAEARTAWAPRQAGYDPEWDVLLDKASNGARYLGGLCRAWCRS